MQKKIFAIFIIVVVVLIAGTVGAIIWGIGQNTNTQILPNNYTYRIVEIYPHDTNAFTQGLVFEDDVFYESTGIYGSSSLRRVDLQSGNVLNKFSLSDEYFGEGLAIVGNSLIQLTWKERIGFVYDKGTFTLQKNFTYNTDGWGLTFDDNKLIMSDGSSNLYFFNPTTFEEIGKVSVYDGNKTLENLNELEYIKGDIYANIWLEDSIVIINPNTGQVKGYIDLTGLYQTANAEAVLNGIAYDKQTDRLFVTGKLWSNIYQIELIVKNAP